MLLLLHYILCYLSKAHSNTCLFQYLESANVTKAPKPEPKQAVPKMSLHQEAFCKDKENRTLAGSNIPKQKAFQPKNSLHQEACICTRGHFIWIRITAIHAGSHISKSKKPPKPKQAVPKCIRRHLHQKRAHFRGISAL